MFIYLILSSLALKKYLVNINYTLKKTIAFSFLITALLMCYLIFSVLNLILEILPDSLFIILLTTTGLLIYILISYYIYISDSYKNGVSLLISLIICFAVMGFSPINELYLQNRYFTLFIALFHVLGIYLFMTFLDNQNPKKLQDATNSHI